jgi:hypothetical protein
VPDAEVAETACTSFEQADDKAVTARLGRVRDQNENTAAGQGEPSPAWRHHEDAVAEADEACG